MGADVRGIFGFQKSLYSCNSKEYTKSQTLIRDSFEKHILETLTDLEIHGLHQPRIPNTSSVLFKGCEAAMLLMALDIHGYDVSAGSACSSGSVKFSPVIKAMGYSEEDAAATLRFSFGDLSDISQVKPLVETLQQVVSLQRQL